MGGTLTTERVCSKCNSDLGERIDAALINFPPISSRRAKLGLAGNSKSVPNPLDFLTGQSELVGEVAGRLQTTIDKTTDGLRHRQLFHSAEIVSPDGQKTVQVTIDERDKDQIPTIIKRTRAKYKLPPLSESELAIAAENYETRTIENPLIVKELQFSFAYLQHAMLKIVYELAFIWLGEAYLEDPLAEQLRSAILSRNLNSADPYAYGIRDANEHQAFFCWTPNEAHHLAYSELIAGKIVIAVRLFDAYAVTVVVSNDASRYINSASDLSKLKFMAMDSVSGKKIQTSFPEEKARLLRVAATARIRAPFQLPDPL